MGQVIATCRAESDKEIASRAGADEVLLISEGRQYRLVFSRVDSPDGRSVPLQRIFELSAKMTPVFVADVDSVSGQVGKTITPPRQSCWGDVKMPIF